MPLLPIVDTHQHLWDLSRFRVPWLSGAPHLDRSFVTSDYFEAAEGLGIVKTLYMEVDLDPAQQAEEAELAPPALAQTQAAQIQAALERASPGQ